MIERYTLPRMSKLWSEESKFQRWLEIEILVCEAWAELDRIPLPALERIKKRARFNLERIREIEAKVDHDLIAFLSAVAEEVGEESRYIHLGLTSYDVEDTALSLRLQEAGDILIADLEELIVVVRKRAREYKNTVMVGRTHGVHAEPVTFGLKLALWLTELQRAQLRIREAKQGISFGKISGAVGTYAHCPPFIEEYVCGKLGLEPESISTQILQRDRHAHYLMNLALAGSSLDKFATEIRNLQRTEVLEVEEHFVAGQKGSSAMPHKRNPWHCERISGLARVLRANAIVGLENVVLWHERDLTNSSSERIILPDSTILLDFMLSEFTKIVKHMVVYPEKMKHNLEQSHGLVFSQKVLLELAEKGITREQAYALVQRNAMKSWQEGVAFKDLLKQDAELKKYLSTEEIEKCFDLDYYLRHVGHIFGRLGI